MKRVAFIGNPNVGKSAIINALSGANLRVGNWPGVTVEKKEALLKVNDKTFHLIDLPGTYSLVGHTVEERLTRDFLFQDSCDLIINVIDVTDLERNLNLTLSLRELQIPMIVVLNFYDELDKLKHEVNIKRLEQFLKCKVIALSAKTKLGLDVLQQAIFNLEFSESANYYIYYSDKIESIYLEIIELIQHSKHEYTISECKVAMLYLENYAPIHDQLSHLKEYEKINNDIKQLEVDQDETIDYIVQQSRYHLIKQMIPQILKKSDKSRITFTRKVDRIILHKYLGLPLFVLLSILMINIVFDFSAPYIDFVDQFINDFIGKYVGLLLQETPELIQSMFVDGIIGGIGAVLTFVPLMTVLYLFMGFVEESGYMARTAFLLDRIMKRFGLNGKSFVSMVLGFGCTVPAIYSTRTLEDPKSRRLTALMIPFMSCGARLPVYVLFAGVFFPSNAGVVIVSLYMLGIAIALIIGLVSKKFNLFNLEEKALIIELPPYRLPDFRVVFKSTLSRVKSYFKKAFTLIFAVLFILWGLSYFPTGDVKDSYIAKGAQAVAPIFEPAGFGESWQAVAAIPGSIAAKEVVVGFLGQVLDVNDLDETQTTYYFFDDLQEQGILLLVAIRDSFTSVLSITSDVFDDTQASSSSLQIAVGNLFSGPYKSLSAFSFMIFILLSVPCVATLSALKAEFGTRFMGLVVIMMLIVPYVVSVMFFQLAKLIVDIV